MPNSTHTPGPWKTEPHGFERAIVGADYGRQGIVAKVNMYRVNDQKEEDGEANASLIAAAPDMLQALEYAAEIIKLAREYFPRSIKNGDKFALENANASICKAIHQAKGQA